MAVAQGRGGKRVSLGNLIILVLACLFSFFVGFSFRPSCFTGPRIATAGGTVSCPKCSEVKHENSGVLQPTSVPHDETAQRPDEAEEIPTDPGPEELDPKETLPPATRSPLLSPKKYAPLNNKKKSGGEEKQIQGGGVAKLEVDAHCESSVRSHYEEYYQYSLDGHRLRTQHGTLNIAGFSRLWPPPIHGTGGMQFHAQHLYSQLAALGHRVHVFTTQGHHGAQKIYFDVDKNTLKLSKVTGAGAQAKANLVVQTVESSSPGEYSELWYANTLREFTKVNATMPGGGFQVAHSESWAGVPNIYQLGLQMAVTWHGSMLDWFRNEINLIVHNYRLKGNMTGKHTVRRMSDLGSSVAYEAYALLTIPHHITISDSAEKDLREVNLVDPKRVHLIYNGVNANNFKPGPATRAIFLAEHHVPLTDFVVGCGGRLEGIKGHLQLSKAMAVILQRHRDVTLVVAGSGAEGPKYEALKAKGLKVVMLGMMKQEQLAAMYQSLDVFIDPFYQHHGLNTVMIEAVLSGVPIIATALASADTTAPCSEFGLTFALGDVGELVHQIEVLKLDEALRQRVSANVRQRAVHLFTSAIMAGSYESLLYKAYLNPTPLEPVVGKVVCKHAYPAMCYREPRKEIGGTKE